MITQTHKATENSEDPNSLKHCISTLTDTTDRSYLHCTEVKSYHIMALSVL